MKTYAERCAACGGGSGGMHTGEVPTMEEMIRRGPAKMKDMDWSAPVCSLDCAADFRAGKRFVPAVTQAGLDL